MRDEYFEKAFYGYFPKLEYRLSDIEADVKILSDLYGYSENKWSDFGKCSEEELNEMNSSFEKLMETYEQLKCKLGKQQKDNWYDFLCNILFECDEKSA